MEHSSHPHLLILNQNYIAGEGDVCHSCREQVVSSKSFVYCYMSITGNTDSSITTGAECAEFLLHKSCAELPQHIQIPTKSQKFLIFCYRCIRCQFWMHKSCGDAPTSFQFQFHSKHPLILKFSLPLVYQKFHQYCKLCSILQLIAAYMMVEARNKKGYNGYLFSVPSYNDLKHIYSLAAPVFVTMISKVTFYSLLVYFVTSLGIQTIAAHQVMIQIFCMCAVWAEPLSQTAQSSMPEQIHGANRNSGMSLYFRVLLLLLV